MKTWWKKFWRRFWNDELFFKRWARAFLGSSGASLASLAGELGGLGASQRTIIVLRIVGGLLVGLAMAINLGDKNPPPAPKDEP